MKRIINIHPNPVTRVALGILPFVIVLLVYLWASDARLAENPDDKLMPPMTAFSDAIERMAFEPSKRSGEYLLWVDTLASLERLLTGVAIAATLGLIFGIMTGAIPLFRAKLSPFFTVISLIPPMAILPILFIIFGLGEVSKIMLIVIGVTPFIIRDLQAKTIELPVEQIIKGQTLGMNSWHIIRRVIIPQIMPRLLHATRLSLGAAWLFLIAAEAVASQEGLGYRIFLVRRYLAMDVILPYVAWITCLAFLLDWLLKTASQRLYPWFHKEQKH